MRFSNLRSWNYNYLCKVKSHQEKKRLKQSPDNWKNYSSKVSKYLYFITSHLWQSELHTRIIEEDDDLGWFSDICSYIYINCLYVNHIMKYKREASTFSRRVRFSWTLDGWQAVTFLEFTCILPRCCSSFHFWKITQFSTFSSACLAF